MLRQLVLNKKLTGLRGDLTKLDAQEQELAKRAEDLAGAVDQAEADEELAALEDEATAIEGEKGELQEKKSKLEEEIAAIEAELGELKSKEPKNTERNKGAENVDKKNYREALELYVRSKGRILREDDGGIEGFKVVDGGILVPDDIRAPEEFKRDVLDLAKYVRVIQVNRGSGKIPVIKKSGGAMLTVDELEANPELQKPEIDQIPYDIATYRGYIPISAEVIDDADFNVTGLIAEEIADQELNTKNAKIAAVLKDATAKAAAGLDGLKGILNKDLKRVYNVKLFVTASLYNELDTAKDKTGRYLLQDSITAASGKSFAGREIEVLDDDVLGDGVTNLNAFIGDAREFCALFDRKRASVKWTDHNIYGELLAGFVRFDVGVVDEDAGFYVTYEPETDDDGGGGSE